MPEGARDEDRARPGDSASFLRLLVEKLEATARESVARLTGGWAAETIVPPHLRSLESAALCCDWEALQRELDNHVWQGGRGDPDWRIGLALAKIGETCEERGLEEYAAFLYREAATVLEVFSPRELAGELSGFAKRLRSKTGARELVDEPDECKEPERTELAVIEWVESEVEPAGVPLAVESDWREESALNLEGFALLLLADEGPQSLAVLPSWEWETRLQTVLAALREAGTVSRPVLERGLDWMAAGSQTTAASLLSDYLRFACEQRPDVRDVLLSRFTQKDYARFTGFRELPAACANWDDWEYQGWAVYEDDWPVAAAAWKHLPEGRLLEVLGEPFPQERPVHQTLHYLIVRKLWRDNAVSLARLSALAKLAQRSEQGEALRPLYCRVILVLADQWKRFNWEQHQRQATQVAAVLAEIGKNEGFGEGMELTGVVAVAPPPATIDPDAGLPPVQRQRVRRIRSLTQHLSAHPEDSGSWHDLARLHVDNGDLPKAIEAEGRAIESNPLFAAAYHGRAKLHMRLKSYPQARADFSNVIVLFEERGGMEQYLTTEAPTSIYTDSYRTRGVAWCHEGDYDRGLQDLQLAVKLSPYDPVLRWEYGYLLEKAGRTVAAIDTYSAAGRLAGDGQNDALIAKCVHALRGLGAMDQARALEAAVRREQENDLP